MTIALLAALMRALPMALCLPLPGVVPRIALGLVLASAGLGVPGLAKVELARLPAELVLGLALGLLVAAPVWAARYAGGLVGATLESRKDGGAFGLLFGTLAWVVFCGVGGLSMLLDAYLGSYARSSLREAPAPGTVDTLVRAGGDLLALSCKLALPALLSIAILELGAASLARFEESAGFDLGAQRIARGARPVLAMLLVVASLAAVSHGVGLATRGLGPNPSQ